MRPLVIGIAGGTGSGKTSVTNRILERLDRSRVAVLQHDSYYKDLSEHHVSSAREVNFDHPDSLETSLLVRNLRGLKGGKSVNEPIYNFTTHKRLDSIRTVEPRDLMGIKIFVDADADERLIRRLRRDILERGRSMESVMEQYMRTVKPMHLEFVEPSKHWADIIVPRGAENLVAIDMIVARIVSMLHESADGRET